MCMHPSNRTSKCRKLSILSVTTSSPTFLNPLHENVPKQDHQWHPYCQIHWSILISSYLPTTSFSLWTEGLHFLSILLKSTIFSIRKCMRQKTGYRNNSWNNLFIDLFSLVSFPGFWLCFSKYSTPICTWFWLLLYYAYCFTYALSLMKMTLFNLKYFPLPTVVMCLS